MQKLGMMLFFVMGSVFFSPNILGHDSDDLPPPLQKVQEFLELSPQQVSEYLALREDFEDQLLPIHQELTELEESLKSELELPQPSADVVGSLVIQIHDLREEAAELKRDLMMSFASILNMEQTERYQLIRVAGELIEILPAFKALGLI